MVVAATRIDNEQNGSVRAAVRGSAEARLRLSGELEKHRSVILLETVEERKVQARRWGRRKEEERRSRKHSANTLREVVPGLRRGLDLVRSKMGKEVGLG